MSECKGSWLFIFEVQDEVLRMKINKILCFHDLCKGNKNIRVIRQREIIWIPISERKKQIICKEAKYNYGTKQIMGYFWYGICYIYIYVYIYIRQKLLFF